MELRLGDVLVSRGVLTSEQRDRVLEVQRSRSRPFGLLAEELFGVEPGAVEQAWAEQYASIVERVDLRCVEPDATLLGQIEPRQAWQFGVLPVRVEGGEVVLCTCAARLARALRFVGWRLAKPCSFLIAEPDALGRALARHYPMPGLDASSLMNPNAGFKELLASA